MRYTARTSIGSRIGVASLGERAAPTIHQGLDGSNFKQLFKINIIFNRDCRYQALSVPSDDCCIIKGTQLTNSISVNHQ